MKNFFATFCLLVLCVQPVTLSGQESFHKKLALQNSTFLCEKTFVTADSAILLTGFHVSGYFYQVLVKLDFHGNVIWVNKYQYTDYHRKPYVYQTQWNQIIISTWSPNEYVIYIVDENGLGISRGGMPGSYYDVGICSFPDSVVFLATYTNSSTLIKTDHIGNLLWEKKYSASAGFQVVFKQVIQIDNDKMLIASDPPNNGSIVMIDTTGQVIGAEKLIVNDTLPLGIDKLNIHRGDGGSVFLTGYANGWVICKLDSNRSILWARKINCSGLSEITGITHFPDGDVMITGPTSFGNAIKGSVICRISSSGELLSHYIIGSDSIQYHSYSSVSAINNASFAFSSFQKVSPVYSHIYFSILDSTVNGKPGCNTHSISMSLSNLAVTKQSFTVDTNGTGSSSYYRSPVNTVTDVLTDSLLCKEVKRPVEVGSLSLELSPNPAIGVIHFQLGGMPAGEAYSFSCYDVLGKLMIARNVEDVNQIIDLHNFSNGIYILHIRTKSGDLKKKFVVL